jgi:hypothetical protein
MKHMNIIAIIDHRHIVIILLHQLPVDFDDQHFEGKILQLQQFPYGTFINIEGFLVII